MCATTSILFNKSAVTSFSALQEEAENSATAFYGTQATNAVFSSLFYKFYILGWWTYHYWTTLILKIIKKMLKNSTDNRRCNKNFRRNFPIFWKVIAFIWPIDSFLFSPLIFFVNSWLFFPRIEQKLICLGLYSSFFKQMCFWVTPISLDLKNSCVWLCCVSFIEDIFNKVKLLTFEGVCNLFSDYWCNGIMIYWGEPVMRLNSKFAWILNVVCLIFPSLGKTW